MQIKLLMCILIISMCLMSCINKKDSTSVQNAPNFTATIVLKGFDSKHSKLTDVVELTYNEDTDIIHYIRYTDGKYITGIVTAENSIILIGNSVLRYDKDKGWYLVLINGEVRFIYNESKLELSKVDK